MVWLAFAFALVPVAPQLDLSSKLLEDPAQSSPSHLRLLGASVTCTRYGKPGGVGGYTAFIGAPGEDSLGVDAGAVHFYDSGDWIQSGIGLGPVAAGDQVGQVAVDRNTLVVGAWRAGALGGANETGVVRLYSADPANSSWTLEQTLGELEFSAAEADRFSAVDVQGDKFVVGAKLADGAGVDSGAAFVVERVGTTWSNTPVITQLIPTQSALAAGDQFGSVTIFGDIAVVGARRLDTTTITDPQDICPAQADSCEQGAVFVFSRQGPGAWVNTGLLLARVTVDSNGFPVPANSIPPPILIEDDFEGDEFGFSVALSEDWLVVGAPGRDIDCVDAAIEVNCDTGAVYVYKRTGSSWAFFQRLQSTDSFSSASSGSVAPSPGIFQRFGYSVAIDGQRIVVGAPGTLMAQTNDSSINTGAVFVYDFGSEGGTTEAWIPTRSLMESDIPPLTMAPPPTPPASSGTLGPFFGSSVDVACNLVVVGAPRAQVDGVDWAGRAYVFNLPTEEDAFFYPSLCNGDGGSVVMGQACTDCPCMNNAPPGTIGGCLNSLGRSARLNACGTSSVTSDTLRFEVEGVPPGGTCLLLSGLILLPAPASMSICPPGSGISGGLFTYDGLRCIGQITRLGTRIANVTPDELGTVGIVNRGWGAPDGPVGGLLFRAGASMAGEVRHFQVQYRENPLAGCLKSFNWTNAISVTTIP